MDSDGLWAGGMYTHLHTSWTRPFLSLSLSLSPILYRILFLFLSRKPFVYRIFIRMYIFIVSTLGKKPRLLRYFAESTRQVCTQIYIRFKRFRGTAHRRPAFAATFCDVSIETQYNRARSRRFRLKTDCFSLVITFGSTAFTGVTSSTLQDPISVFFFFLRLDWKLICL